MIAFYNGVTGMMAHQEKMNVVSHNIANVNTNGYKSSRSSFSDLLYTQMNTIVEGENLVGHGVKHQGTDLLMNESGFEMTENMLDFSIAGGGFFAIDNNGTREYTRNGAFDLSVEGKSAYLVTSDGKYVLDESGKKINVPFKKDTTTPNLEGLDKKIGIYTFTNPFGLKTMNGSCFVETDNSGKGAAIKAKSKNGAGIEIKQGFLESSGTDLASEMVQMIEAQRGFQLNVKVVQTADSLDDTINNLR